MKKYIFILAGVAALLAACTKEEKPVNDAPVNNDPVVEEEPLPVHELFVSIPDLEDADADSRVGIAEADGSFTWTTGDEIAVKNSDNTVYKFVAQGSGNSTRFTYTGTMTGTPETVVYPYTSDATVSLPTTLTNPKGGILPEGICMSGTISNNAVTLSYVGALLKLTFTNAPTFASKIVFDGNEADVTVSGISLSERGEIVAYLPVDVRNTSYTVSLTDDNDNVILSRSTTSPKTFAAGTIKKMRALNVPGTVFIFNDELNQADEARFFKSTGSSTDWNISKYITLNTLSSGKKWCILTEDWAMSCLQMFKNSTYVNSTDCIYLYRDFEFTIPSAGGLVTNYRTYYYLKSSNSQQWWGNTTKVHIKVAGTYSGEETMTKTGDYLFYYENSPDNYGKQMSYQFHNGNNWYASTDYWTYTLNREYQYDFNG